MTYSNSAELVEAFWAAVWQGRNPEAVEDFVTDDFVITNAGEDITGKQNFKNWIQGFLDRVEDFEFDILETFQNADGSRVASRWRVRGKNNGLLGTEPDGQPVSFTGTAVWAVREDGKLTHNWVERASFELYQRLTANAG